MILHLYFARRFSMAFLFVTGAFSVLIVLLDFIEQHYQNRESPCYEQEGRTKPTSKVKVEDHCSNSFVATQGRSDFRIIKEVDKNPQSNGRYTTQRVSPARRT